MQDLATFRQRVWDYRFRSLDEEGRTPNQAQLAAAIGLSKGELSNRLNGNKKARLTCENVRAIINTLARWGAFETRTQAQELVALSGCPALQADDWRNEPLNRLEVGRDRTAANSVTLALNRPPVRLQSENVLTPRDNISYPGRITDPYYVGDLPTNPYLGLKSFAYDTRARYAGRDEESAQAVARITSPDQPQPLYFVIGASGAGKSSFAQAALLPTLEQYYAARGKRVVHAVFRPAQRPLTRLYDTLTLMQFNLPTADLILASLGEAAPQLTRLLSATPADQVNVLVIDQFEELFTQSESAAQRDGLLAAMQQLASQPFSATHTHVIATMRFDYLPSLYEWAALYDLAAKHGSDLRVMDEPNLRRAILRPFDALYGGRELRFEPELIQRLVEDARADATLLPLLQFCLEDIWRKGWLRLAAYNGLTATFNRHAEQIYAFDADRRPRSDADKAAIIAIFLDLTKVLLNDSEHDTRQSQPRDRLLKNDAARRERLLNELVDTRLLSSNPQAEGATDGVSIDIIHESLLRNWLRLAQAIKEHRQQLQQRERFRLELLTWQDHAQPDDYLLIGIRLAEARALDEQGDIALAAPAAQEFFRRSVAQAESKAHQQMVNAARAAVSDSFRLAYESRRLTQSNPPLATLLAYEAVARDPNPAAEQALRDALDRFRWRPTALRGHRGQINGAAFSPDGQRVATTSEDGTVTIWSINGGRLVNLVGHRGAVSSVAFSPDGRQLVTASADGTVRVWSASGRELIALRGHQERVDSATFSPNGQLIVSAAHDRTARVWQREGGELATLHGHRDQVHSAVFSPDSKLILTASADRTARLWHIDGTEVAALVGHDDAIKSATFSPDGKLIVTASNDGSARIWEVRGQQQTVLSGHTGKLRAATFSPDNQLVVTASADRTARIWNVASGEAIILSGHEGWVTSAMFSPDGRQVVTASADGTARVWSVNGEEQAILSAHRARANDARFSSGGEHIVTTADDDIAWLWQSLGDDLPTLRGHSGVIRNAVFSPDGSRMATAADDQTARIWDEQGHELTALRGHQERVIDVAFSPDGQQLITASADGTVRLWNLTGAQLSVIEVPGRVRSAAFSPDGQQIVTAADDHTARIWDRQGQPLAVLHGHREGLHNAAYSSDSKYIVTASDDRTARIWDNAGSERAILSGHSGQVYNAAFSPDGKLIVTVSDDNTARIWDIIGKPLAALRGHSGFVASAHFSPDGQQIVTASDDKTVRIWNLSGRELIVLRGHSGCVYSAVYSPDGRSVLTASADGTARRYFTHSADLLTAAATHLSRGLSDDELQRYNIDNPRFSFAH